VREIIENFQLEKIITKLAKNDLLYQLAEMFTEVDLSPANVTNHEMGYIFQELLRRFSKMSNEIIENVAWDYILRLIKNPEGKLQFIA
jgi:type I restriction enzyme M protein